MKLSIFIKLKSFFGICTGCLLLLSFTFLSNFQSFNLNKDGSVTFNPDENKNIVPDFSRVGYHQGDKEIPDVKIVKTISPAETGSSEQLIQAAIDDVAEMPVDKNGFRGAILLKKGTYLVSGTINITKGGIVLKGEGDNAKGTRLLATGKLKRSLVLISGTGSAKEIKDTRTSITDAYLPTGSFSFKVANARNFKVGDDIIIYRPGTDKWIHDLKMDEITPILGTLQWTPKEYNLNFERKIVKVKGNQIFIDNPTVMPLETKYGGAEIFKYSFEGRIAEAGIENIFFESEFTSESDEEHAWTAIEFNKIEQAWVRNVAAKYFANSCVSIQRDAKYITVLQSRCDDAKSVITGSRRYSFDVDGQFNLVRDCEATEGRHDFVTGAKTLGPNVFYNCKASKAFADIGPHHRWSAGTLYDNIITDGEINIQDRGNYGTGHGWVGTTQVLWNCKAKRTSVQTPWVSGKNYSIGLVGQKYGGRLAGRPDGVWESLNKPVEPKSLYIAQLNARHKSQN